MGRQMRRWMGQWRGDLGLFFEEALVCVGAGDLGGHGNGCAEEICWGEGRWGDGRRRRLGEGMEGVEGDGRWTSESGRGEKGDVGFLI